MGGKCKQIYKFVNYHSNKSIRPTIDALHIIIIYETNLFIGGGFAIVRFLQQQENL